MFGLRKTGLKDRLGALLEHAAHGLTESDKRNAKVLIEAGEPGIAFELICTQLYENDAEISLDLLQEIRGLAAALQLEDSTWGFLERNLVVPPGSPSRAQ